MVEESSPPLPPAEESIEAVTDTTLESEPESGEPTPELANEPDFVCDCEESMRSACKDQPLYKAHGSKRYCVLHLPAKEKRLDFQRALRRKLDVEDYDFRGVWFPEGCFFRGSHFRKPVDFSYATFSDGADFARCVFEKQTDFPEADFLGDAKFSGAVFLAEVHFHKTAFVRNSDFSSVRFSRPAYFSRSFFDGESLFSSASFDAMADFSWTAFKKKADFMSVSFGEWATFLNARFKAGARFPSARFRGKAVFSGCTFDESANFYSASFNEPAAFVGTAFKDAAFSHAVFDAEVDFSFSTFKRSAIFFSATFRDYARFLGRTDETFADGPSVGFQYARLEKPDRFCFHTVVLRPFWFVNLDVSKLDFTNVEWQASHIKSEIEALENHGIGPPHRLISVACRQLATNSEEHHRYEEASQFRYMSMDARRREKSRGFAFWTLHWWYWAATGYGERVFQAFVGLIVVLVFFALFYTQVGFTRPSGASSAGNTASTMSEDNIGGPLQVSRAFTYSLAVMSLQKPEPKPLTGTAQTLVLLETILGPVQAALLALAIRRKFMR